MGIKHILKNILKDQIELLLNSDEMNIDFNYNSIFDSQLEKLENVIEQYISYINNETIKRNQEQSQSDIVYFVPEETDGNVRRNGAPKEVHPEEHERKNNVMATDYRDSVINGLKPIKTKIAMSSVKVKTYDGEEFEEDIDSIYTCSLVSLGNNEYKLIMEPFNGIRYTKIAYFVFEGEMTDEELNDIIKKYVSLNTEHILNSNNIIRIGHTSTNAFMNSVWYAVLKDNRLKCRKYFIEKVNNMVPEVIERQKNL